jgi:peptidoglycan/xylan/chitin deacetylase (PgdA/CDA1 family)
MPPRINRRLRTGAYRAIYALGRFVGDGGITILSYHSLDRHGTPLSVPPRLFAAHMETLAREGCPTFTMSEVTDHLALQLPFPPRAVAVTFDDAFANVAEVAVPILRRHGFSATVYVITGMVGKVTRWTDRGDPLPPLPIMSWGQIESLSSSGIEVGSHSVSHGFLTTCAPEDLRCEMADSKATLQSRLGVPVTHFAYPQGDYNESVKAGGGLRERRYSRPGARLGRQRSLRPAAPAGQQEHLSCCHARLYSLGRRTRIQARQPADAPLERPTELAAPRSRRGRQHRGG